MQRRITAALLLLVAVIGCREDDGFIGGPGGARAYVTSDPPGGRILVDGRETARTTPDTIRGLTGRHDILVRLDSDGASYRYTAEVVLSNPDSVADVDGPLLLRCSTPTCYQDLFRHFAANRLRFASVPSGAVFLANGSTQGLVWPSTSNNSYAAGGMPVFSALMGPDTVALGIYDTHYLAGRPVPDIVQDGERVLLRQGTWIVPPFNLLQFATVRGVRIEESILSTRAVDDVVVLRLVFHNITADPLYQLLDPYMTAAGQTFRSAYIGFALDPDIGTTTDDLLSYDLDLNLAFVYDARFEEGGFNGVYRQQPGIVGLRMLESPAGSTVVLNGWTRQVGVGGDWFAGMANEGTGWGMMSGRRVYAPDHVNARIGHLPTGAGDMRIVVSAGPIDLAPGDSASITVAVVLATPAEGTFISGAPADPGNPEDTSRALYRIAQTLFDRARAAETVAMQFAELARR